MSEDEVELIYDYLHEHYEYQDGELIKNKNGCGRKKGYKLGCMAFKSTGIAAIITGIKIDGKQKQIQLKRLIWIFHHKKCPQYLSHLDGNITNCKIENLVESRRRNLPLIRGSCLDFRNGKYTLALREGSKSYHFGRFECKEEAYQLHQKIYKLNMESNIPMAELKRQYEKKYISKLPTGVNKSGENGFTATFRGGKKRLYLGYYNTPEEAHAAYLKAKEEYKSGSL